MDCTKIPKLPELFVDKKESERRIDDFESKRKLIKSVFRKWGSRLPRRYGILIRKEFFRDMLISIAKSGSASGFRIYFAVFGAANTPYVPGNKGFQFTLIFTGVKESSPHSNVYDDTEEVYYALSHTGSFYEIPQHIAKNWVTIYQQHVLPLLELGLYKGNTKSVIYSKQKTDSFCKEMDYQNGHDKVKSIKAYLSSSPSADLANRLSVEFNFMDEDDDDLYYEEMDDWECRKDTLSAPAVDTATPCPPGSQCGRTSLGNL
jgi:hypothetical protein